MTSRAIGKRLPAIALSLFLYASGSGYALAQNAWKSPLTKQETGVLVEYLNRIGQACSLHPTRCTKGTDPVPFHFVIPDYVLYAPPTVPHFVEIGARVVLCDLPKYSELCKTAFK
jgi:hypothetical protein